MKFLILGATGYTGRALVQRLTEDGHQVSTFTRRGLSTSERQFFDSNNIRDLGLLTSETVLNDLDFDFIISLTGLALSDHSFSDIRPLVEAQVTIQLQLLELGRLSNCPVLLSGSYWESVPSVSGTDLNLYASLNKATSSLATYFCNEFGVRVGRLILADTYGPRDWRPKLIPQLFEFAGSDQILQLGSPSQVIAPLYISDVVDGFLAMIDAKWDLDSQAFTQQIFPSEVIRLDELVQLVEELSRKSIKVDWNLRKSVRTEVKEIKASFHSPKLWIQNIQLRDGLSLVQTIDQIDP